MARAIQWANRIMAVSLEMVLPGVVGVLVDKYLGTLVVFTLVGFALGFTAAGLHLAAITRPSRGREELSASDATNENTAETED